jgi:DNA primase catalytic subunit
VLRDNWLSYQVYFSGSKGTHIHIRHGKLRLLSKEEREEQRGYIIELCGCDKQKARDRQMIALEFAPHWKTGNPKTLLEQWGNNWDLE